jgi:2-phosphoglycerate kinase
MIYRNEDAYLFATGLSLVEIAQVLTSQEDIETILKQRGSKYLERYLTVKQYYQLAQQGEQKLPIIPLIIGMPGVGKTALAKELSNALGISLVIGGDSLRSSLRQFISNKDNEVFNSSVYNTWKLYGEKTKESILEGYKAQANIMNKAVQYMIADRGLRDGESMIIEYLHFLPSQFDLDILKHPSIMPVIVKITDQDIYKSRIKDRSKFTHLRSSGDRLLSKIDIYQTMQEYLCEEANKFDMKIVTLDDFQSGFEEILDFCINRITILNTTKNIENEPDLVKKLKSNRLN